MHRLRSMSVALVGIAGFVGVAAASGGCARGSGDPAPPEPSTGGGGSLPGDVSQAHGDASAAGSDGMGRNDASSGGASPEDAGGGAAGSLPDVDYDAYPPPPPAPICPARMAVAASDTFFRLGPSDAILGSVTPDGLSVAWTLPGSNAPGGTTPTTVFVADRASENDAFGAPQQVDFGQALVAPDKVTLSPDRLRLVAVLADRLGFVELTRGAAASPFDSPSEADFADINAAARATQDPLGDPTLAADDRAFFYTRALAVIESERSGVEPWPEGTARRLDYALNPGQQARISAVSADHLTLFFWDDQRSIENAAWRVFADEAFQRVVSLPVVPRAQPSADCGRLFFASMGTGGVDLAVASVSSGP
ncbi:MAG TPA: hypothetical protein VMG12_19665 [Polyangiaceae bacterium]|nr:hypothetical protein [Polyangiaceae bacterium]